MSTLLSPTTIQNMPYVEFMAFLKEVNRPPGGKSSIRRVVQNSFIGPQSRVIDVGCNTGYCTFEIAHLAHCKVTGIDISKDMIAVAKQCQAKDPLGHLVNFKVADGMSMPFGDNVFDVAFSGGSTAFIENKKEALREYVRVVKPWGFIADINFFYHKKPPKRLLTKLNDLLGIAIEPWDVNYWVDLYQSCGLEQYEYSFHKMGLVTQGDVRKYCSVIAKKEKYEPKVESAIYTRLSDVMQLFNENHGYLSFGIFINRKRPFAEQVSLFGA